MRIKDPQKRVRVAFKKTSDHTFGDFSCGEYCTPIELDVTTLSERPPKVCSVVFERSKRIYMEFTEFKILNDEGLNRAMKYNNTFELN